MSYQKLLRENASETDLQQYLFDSGQVASTVRISKKHKGSAAEIAKLRGISFSAFVCNCLIQELTKGR